MANKTKNKKVNINNPFVLLQAILLGIIRLLMIITLWIFNVAALAVQKWIIALIIIAAILITLYSMGVMTL